MCASSFAAIAPVQNRRKRSSKSCDDFITTCLARLR
jgi:hypothetical protein